MIARHDVKLSLFFVTTKMFEDLFNERLRFFIFFNLAFIGHVSTYQYLIDATYIPDIIHSLLECRL